MNEKRNLNWCMESIEKQAFERGKRTSQKEMLDKIRAEIDRQEKWLLDVGYTMYNVDIAFSAIKSALAESEEDQK